MANGKCNVLNNTVITIVFSLMLGRTRSRDPSWAAFVQDLHVLLARFRFLMSPFIVMVLTQYFAESSGKMRLLNKLLRKAK